MTKRTRRAPEEARKLILEAAEARMVDAGPQGVTVQGIAKDLGMTDAAIHHHFGSRDALLETLARFGARRLRENVEQIIARSHGTVDIARLVERILDTFERRGYSRLVLWLGMRGVPLDRDSGMFDSVVHAFEEAGRTARPGTRAAGAAATDAQFAAALLVLVCAAEPLLGTISRRSAGLGSGQPTTRKFRRWFADVVAELVRGAGSRRA